MKPLFAAIAFLTRIPVGRNIVIEASDVAASAAWFPFVGLLLGGFYTLVAALLLGHLPSAAIAVILIVVDALATGALHLDGLADTADGFGAVKSREETLRIMRDHAIGSYGGTALALILLLKAAAYTTLLTYPNRMPALILTPVLGRWSILLLTATLPYARQSASVIEGMNKRALAWGTLTMLLAAAACREWKAPLAVVAVSAAFGLCCRKRIAGITGDTLGANLELCESAALFAFLWT